MSLDLSQGFDRATPELTVGMMARQGFPVQWAQYLMHCMGQAIQVAYVEWGNAQCARSRLHFGSSRGPLCPGRLHDSLAARR